MFKTRGRNLLRDIVISCPAKPHKPGCAEPHRGSGGRVAWLVAIALSYFSYLLALGLREALDFGEVIQFKCPVWVWGWGWWA